METNGPESKKPSLFCFFFFFPSLTPVSLPRSPSPGAQLQVGENTSHHRGSQALNLGQGD